MKRSYSDFCPTQIPLVLKYLDGIKSCFTILLSLRQMQKKNFTSFFCLFLLKIHQPFVFKAGFPFLTFLLYKLQTFTSIPNPFLSIKSGPLLNGICLAFNNLEAYCSHKNPFPVSVSQKSGLLLSEERVYGLDRKKYARLIHIVEQYFLRASLIPQNAHFIVPNIL